MNRVLIADADRAVARSYRGALKTAAGGPRSEESKRDSERAE
jgi:hypothetical protein